MTRQRRNEIVSRSCARHAEARSTVERILCNVKRDGDAALRKYTKRFDKVDLPVSGIRVGKGDIARAYRIVDREYPDLVSAIRTTIECIRAYHEGEVAQLSRGLRGWQGIARSSRWRRGQHLRIGQLRTPIDSVGVYVPGGNAPLFTSALMAVTPARVAGVPRIVVASPPNRGGDIDPKIVVAADIAGADLIVRAGGAQAIGAMAYGTASVPRVAKIVGPGNIYVAAAKACVAAEGACAIDLPAGPSEILVIADDSADVEYIAHDMLSQAEHDADACAVLVAVSRRIAEGVRKFIRDALLKCVAASDRGTRGARNEPIVARSIRQNGAILLADSLDQAVAFANEFAPEHLEIMARNPRSVLPKIRNAGGIFLGKYSPVAVGDYVCPNHILPTGGAARFTSGVNVDTFLRRPSVLEVPRGMIETLDRLVETLSKAEGLYAQHGASVHARLNRTERMRGPL